MNANILNILNTPLFDLLKNQNKDARIDYMINEIFINYDVICLKNIFNGTAPYNRKAHLINKAEKIGFVHCLQDPSYISDNGMIILSKLKFDSTDMKHNNLYVKICNVHIFVVNLYNLEHLQSKVNIKDLYIIYDNDVLENITEGKNSVIFNKGLPPDDDYEYDLTEHVNYTYESSNIIKFPEINSYGIISSFVDSSLSTGKYNGSCFTERVHISNK